MVTEVETNSGSGGWSVHGFGAVTVGALLLYLPFRTTHYDLNGITEALAVEGGGVGLWMPNHLLFRPLGWIVWNASAPWREPAASAVATLQVLSGVFGAIAVGFLYVALSRTFNRRSVAAGVAMLAGATWAHWTTSTDIAYMTMAAAAVAASVAVLVHAESTRGYVAAGAVAGVAILVWQASVFLVPGLAAGAWLLPRAQDGCALPHRRWSQAVGLVAAAGGISVAGYVGVGVAVYGIEGPVAFFDWVTRYGGAVLPSYGSWGVADIPTTASSIFGSVVSIDFIDILDFRRRIGLDARPTWLGPVGFVVMTSVLLAGTFLRARRGADRARIGAWALMCYVPPAVFTLWWDPEEMRWLIVPNLFLAFLVAGIVARFSTSRMTAALFLAGGAVVVLANFRSSVFPRHFQPSPMRETAGCVARNMNPEDALVASEWNWAGYLPYFHERRVVNLIDRVTSAGSLEAGLESARRSIAGVERDGGRVFVIDPSSYTPAQVEWVEDQIGLGRRDLESFVGPFAFECGSDRFHLLAETAGSLR